MGELAGVAATPPRALTEEEKAELAERAHELERSIVKKRQLIETTGMHLARDLCEFLDKRCWQVLGYDSENQFLASPDVNLSKDHARKLARLYRELVEERGVTLAQLAGAGVEKLQIGLPALKAGKVGPQDLVSDAKALSTGDMIARYREGDPDDRLAAHNEPEKATCDRCGSYVAVERLKGKA